MKTNITFTIALLASAAIPGNAQAPPPPMEGAPAPCGQTRTILIGDVDNFTAGGPMAKPFISQALAAMFGARPRRPFDDIQGDKVPLDIWFGASLPLGSCKVCRASLEIRIRRNPGAGLTDNDAIYVGTAPFTGLNLIATVKPWLNDKSMVKIVTIDLTSKLSQLNQLIFGVGLLDVLIQDDSSVDYIKLTVTQ